VEFWLNRGLFLSLLSLIMLVAIPYGTVEPWWSAVYQVCIFSLAALAITTQALTNHRASSAAIFREWRMFLPIAALLCFVFLQSVSLPQSYWHKARSLPLSVLPGKQTISSDPFETRLLFLKLLALSTNYYLLILYTSSRGRLQLLVQAVIGVAVASALFGIVRQALQHSDVGFFLPYLRRDSGFGQFINKNHFAFLMEMGIGLGTGFLFAGGAKREGRLVYGAALVVMWVALVQTASRGAVFSMLTQMVFLIVAMIWVRSRRLLSGPPEAAGGRLFSRLASAVSVPHLLRRVALGVSLVAVVVLGTVWLGGDLLVTRMESLSSELKSDGDNTEALHAGVKRKEVWGATWLLIKSNPLVGTGFGAYGVAITRFHDGSGKWVPEAAHNDYLELLSAGGLIGAALVVWFVVGFLRRARNQLASDDRVRSAACLAALTGINGVMAHSLVDFGLHVTANAVVLLALVVIATKELPAMEQQRVFE
jgi:O-antigen ligase